MYKERRVFNYYKFSPIINYYHLNDILTMIPRKKQSHSKSEYEITKPKVPVAINLQVVLQLHTDQIQVLDYTTTVGNHWQSLFPGFIFLFSASQQKACLNYAALIRNQRPSSSICRV